MAAQSKLADALDELTAALADLKALRPDLFPEDDRRKLTLVAADEPEDDDDA
jgi:hypothetical protein